MVAYVNTVWRSVAGQVKIWLTTFGLDGLPPTMKILIADDDKLNLKILTKLLTEQGHEPVGVFDGQEALLAFRKDHYPVVISDWIMPLMDGLDLCRTIRQMAREGYTYIILLTALDGKARYLEAMDAGVDDFIRKPLDPDELIARLKVSERILGLRGRVEQLEGLLSICAYCKKIRDDAGTWVEVDRYMANRTDLSFSHGVCMNCHQSLKDQIRKRAT
jgi:CheY-like chemotaxis protein